jgi:hypothetical protein
MTARFNYCFEETQRQADAIAAAEKAKLEAALAAKEEREKARRKAKAEAARKRREFIKGLNYKVVKKVIDDPGFRLGGLAVNCQGHDHLPVPACAVCGSKMTHILSVDPIAMTHYSFDLSRVMWGDCGDYQLYVCTDHFPKMGTFFVDGSCR